MRADRLLNVALALRSSKRPCMFTMKVYAHPCGSPACALGHYAARIDMQDVFIIAQCGSRISPVTLATKTGREIYQVGTEHFGITLDEFCDLFGEKGCGDAQTPEEAAAYIDRFVEKKMKEQGNG